MKISKTSLFDFLFLLEACHNNIKQNNDATFIVIAVAVQQELERLVHPSL
jgi:hypothetical protein